MTWKDQALAHAKEQDPKESCGLLLNIRGKEKYYPCKNLSTAYYENFIIDPLDYAKAEDSLGEITNHLPLISPRKGSDILAPVYKYNENALLKCS